MTLGKQTTPATPVKDNKDSQSGLTPKARAEATAEALQNAGPATRGSYSAHLPNPGRWTRETARCWLSTVQTHLEAHGLYSVVTREVVDAKKSANAAVLIKQYLPQGDQLASSGMADGATLWEIMVGRSSESCEEERLRTRAALESYTLNDAENASDYVTGKLIRLSAFQEFGGTMSDREIYTDFMKGIVAYDANVAFVIDMFSKGDLAQAQANIRRHPGLSRKPQSHPQILLASSDKEDKKPSVNRKPKGMKSPHVKRANSHSNAGAPEATVALDSGATRHIVHDKAFAIAGSIKDAPSTLIQSIGGEVLCPKWVASVAVRINMNRTLILNNVLIEPNTRRNSILEPLLQLSGYRIDRKDKSVVLINPMGEIITSAKVDPAVDLVPNIGTIMPGNEKLIKWAADILPYKLNYIEDQIVDIVLWEAKTELLTACDLLDSAESTLGLARSWFDVLLAKPLYQQTMQEYLSIDTMLLTVQSKAFVTAVANRSLPLSRQRPLTPEEADVMSMFKTEDQTPAVGPFRRTLDEHVPYPSMAWVPATSCVVERLFSVARNMLPYNRLLIHSKNIENQLLVGVFDSLTNLGDLERRSQNLINSIAYAAASTCIYNS